MTFFVLAAAFLLWVVYIFIFASHWGVRHYHIIRSFSSGWLIALLFAEVLPMLFIEASGIIEWRWAAAAVLLGFLLYHLLEKHTYQHARTFRHRQEITLLHASGFWIDNFMKGVLLFLFLAVNVTDGRSFLLLGALVISMASNAINFRDFHEHHLRLPRLATLFVSLSVFLGALAAFLIASSLPYLYLTLSVATGALIYFVVRDEIPPGREGKPVFFSLGILLVLLFLFFLA